MTNACGLYRYRLDDVILVTGHFENLPAYQFEYRSGQALCLVFEKVTENVMFRIVQETVQEWEGVELTDYTAVENIYVNNIMGKILFYFI